jgi:hypothetical protein
MGWVGSSPVLTSEQRTDIKRALSYLQNDKFSEPERQGIFLRLVEIALRKPVNGEFVRANAVARLEAAAEAFRALNQLSDDERGLLLLQGVSSLIWQPENEKAAEVAAESLRLKRGEKDGTALDRRARFIVAQMASAWRHAFEIEPSAAHEGAFYKIANDVLQTSALPRVEKHVLKRILAGK